MRTNILGHNLECVENPAYRTDWMCHSLSLYLLYWLQLQEFRFLSDKQLVWDKQWVWAHYVFINRQQHNYAEDYFISYVNNCLEVEDSSRNSETPEHMFVSIELNLFSYQPNTTVQRLQQVSLKCICRL